MAPTTHQVYLMTADLDASVEFYEQSLGLTCTDHGERSAAFDTGQCTLKVERDFDEETLAAFGMSPPGESRGDGVVVVLEVDDVDAVYETADEHDADTLIQPRDVDWGRRMFLVRDPDGYVLEVSQPIA
ncbi:VOC family protein [Haloarchaeobius litoreus]|uniref:VOC family protein n=1 Tax=Haloarchaeobius litoreus TaxID=755306 RepID=A0ABD6DNC4_9EURY|nr:VOC family protein [Haloarchaeobius litoreus]